MNQKQYNKVILLLVILAICVSVFGTVMVLNHVSSDFVKEEISVHSTGSVSLSISGEPQRYISSGVININIVEDVEKNTEE